MEGCRPASEPSRPFDPSPRRAAISHVTDAGPQGGVGGGVVPLIISSIA